MTFQNVAPLELFSQIQNQLIGFSSSLILLFRSVSGKRKTIKSNAISGRNHGIRVRTGCGPAQRGPEPVAVGGNRGDQVVAPDGVQVGVGIYGQVARARAQHVKQGNGGEARHPASAGH